jgi:hypothetical protein
LYIKLNWDLSKKIVHDAVLFSLIIDAPAVNLFNEHSEDHLFAHFQYDIIELLQNDTEAVNYFGLIPDNGAENIAGWIDDVLFNGVLFRFDIPHIVLGIEEGAEP